MEQLKSLINTLNSHGIPLPLFRDPKTGSASLSFTLVILSFGIVSLALIGKYAAGLHIDMPDAMQLFYGTSALYFGRGFVQGKSDIKVEQKDGE